MVLAGLVAGLVLAAAALLSSSDAVREVLVEGLPWGCVLIPMALGWTLGQLSSTTEA